MTFMTFSFVLSIHKTVNEQYIIGIISPVQGWTSHV